MAMKLVSPKEDTQEIDKHFNPEKSPGMDDIPLDLFEELPPKIIDILRNLLHIYLRLKLFFSMCK